jgi:1,4-alpha-glucan branching enzyme
LRQGREADAQCIVIVNFTPEIRTGYRVPVPRAGRWREVLNSDAAIYGGSNVGNGGVLTALEEQGRATLELVVPPLGALFLIPE